MSRKLGLFRLDNCGYAVPVDSILRVVDSGYCTALVLSPEAMAGMLIHEGEIVPLLESTWLPGVSAEKGLSAAYKVLLTTEFGSVALPADTTDGIVTENRCERVVSDEETAGFFSDCVCYCGYRYQILNTDLFMMSLISP